MMSITALPYSISDIDFIYKNKNISILLAFYLKLNKLLKCLENNANTRVLKSIN